MIAEITVGGEPLFFLANEFGEVWLGGWRSRAVAEARLEQAEECDWDSSAMDCSVDIAMLDDNGVQIVRDDDEPQLTITADDENCADTFWGHLDMLFPEIADQLRKQNKAVVSPAVWEALQKLEGFRDGPAHAREALLVVAE